MAGPVPWVDPVALEEQRSLLTESQFARLHQNVWTEPEDSLATHADVIACATLDGPQDFDRRKRPYVIGVDLGVKRDRSVLVVAHAEAAETYWNGRDRVDKGTRFLVDRKLLWKPTKLRPVRLEDVEVAILQAWESYGHPTVVADPWQAMGLAQRLRARGVMVEEFSFTATSVGRLATVLFGIIRDHRLAIDVHDTELVDELASVRLRETAPGTYRLDHGSSVTTTKRWPWPLRPSTCSLTPAPAVAPCKGITPSRGTTPASSYGTTQTSSSSRCNAPMA